MDFKIKPLSRSSAMNTKSAKKEWVKPAIKEIQIFFECTCYAGSV